MKSVLLVLSLICATVSYAQNDFGYSLNAFNEGDKNFISITIEKGNTCQGIYIERSMDSVTFNEIGRIAGICGSADFDQNYQFTDNFPIPDKVIHYRVRFGSNGPVSRVVSIMYVAIKSDGYKLTPNPVTDNATLYFDNPDNYTYKFEVYDANGKAALTMNGIKADKVVFSAAALQPGTYSFRLSSTASKKGITGKFVVNK